jgi:hypothetical protein
VSATYRVLVSDSMLACFAGQLDATGTLRLPAGLTLAGQLPGLRDLDWAELPRAYWVTFADEGAPPELDGCRVALFLRLEDGQPVIAERRVVA